MSHTITAKKRTGADYAREAAVSKASGVIFHGDVENLKHHLKSICNGRKKI